MYGIGWCAAKIYRKLVTGVQNKWGYNAFVNLLTVSSKYLNVLVSKCNSRAKTPWVYLGGKGMLTRHKFKASTARGGWRTSG